MSGLTPAATRNGPKGRLNAPSPMAPALSSVASGVGAVVEVALREDAVRPGLGGAGFHVAEGGGVVEEGAERIVGHGDPRAAEAHGAGTGAILVETGGRGEVGAAEQRGGSNGAAERMAAGSRRGRGMMTKEVNSNHPQQDAGEVSGGE